MRSFLTVLSAGVIATVISCRGGIGLVENAVRLITTASAADAGVAAETRWEGQRAPGFTLGALDGSRIRLADYRGRVVLVNFWATWCVACRTEMPWLTELRERYRSQGLEILGISVDDDADPTTLATFAHRFHVSYPILLNDAATVSAYGGARFLPQTFVIGRDGRIVRWSYGIRSKDELERTLREALGAPAPRA